RAFPRCAGYPWRSCLPQPASEMSRRPRSRSSRATTWSRWPRVWCGWPIKTGVGCAIVSPSCASFSCCGDRGGLEGRPRGADATGASCAEMRTALVESIARYDAIESRIHAFTRYDAEPALLLDAALETTGATGALLRVPVGVKDIFDTAGVPTERGSTLYAGRIAERDADVVRNLRAAGAVIVGKTVTAELALSHPGPTRNPWDLSRTPGGSAMGSAAAVAAGGVPLAVGSQTNGSVIRPAAL